MDQRGVILALDLASVTGVAFGRAGETPLSLSHRIAEPGAGVGEFLDRYSDWLADLITEHGPAVIVFEAPLIWSGKTALDTARKLIGLAGDTERIAYRRQIKCREANGAQVTKFFTGRGSFPAPDAAKTQAQKRLARKLAKKRAVIDQCKALGWHAEDDNAADALAVFAFAENCLYPGSRSLVPLFAAKAAA